MVVCLPDPTLQDPPHSIHKLILMLVLIATWALRSLALGIWEAVKLATWDPMILA